MADLTLSCVEIYDIEADLWIRAPDLSDGKRGHSSCCLGDFVYVRGDFFERLNVRDFLRSRSEKIKWEPLRLSRAKL